jgi:metallo-beta-lactamase family protein
LVPHAFDTWIALAKGIAMRYRRNGHILGAAALEICLRDGIIERQVVFSGDIGRVHEPMLLKPDPPTAADLVIMESTSTTSRMPTLRRNSPTFSLPRRKLERT